MTNRYPLFGKAAVCREDSHVITFHCCLQVVPSIAIVRYM